MTSLPRLGFAAATLLTVCFGGSANAFVASPVLTGVAPEVLATPVAMCGVTCRNGGRFIPGPPGVCAANGLEWCGPRRGGGPGVVVVPGTGIGVQVGPRPRRECRTITTRRPDGAIVTVRRCD
jgi:hypothetical protein